MPIDIGSDMMRDVGFCVATLISKFRYQKDLPVYFHWIFLVVTVKDFVVESIFLRV